MTGRIGRRELLVAAGTVGVGGVPAYLWTGLSPERGRVAFRELVAGGESLLYEDDGERYLGDVFESLGYESPGEALVSEHLSRLQAEYGGPAYRLGVARDGAAAEPFTTNVGVFDTVDLGDHVAYQVSVRDSGSIRTLSCVTAEAEDLETRCAFDEVDVTGSG